MPKLALILLIFSSSCAISDEVSCPHCGDLVCDLDETARSCPTDCVAVPVCDPAADACAGETICISGQCEPMLSRSYVIMEVVVRVGTTRPVDGAAWDPFGGAPDLFLVGPDGAPTPSARDSFVATFPGPILIEMHTIGQPLTLNAWDDDSPADPDGAFVCHWTATSAFLRARYFGCSGALGSLSAMIQPQ